ncbi:MAG: GLPGLI family protein [Flavobacteriia bacterium]|nr:GLPGLI family protein [Flavobacteriia bacterium]
MFSFFWNNYFFGQLINKGKIIFERKTNLEKKYTDERSKRWLNDQNKIIIDEFELYFDDTLSVFQPIEDPSKKGMMDWATMKNSHIHHLNSKNRISIYNFWGESISVNDNCIKRQWKITENKRKIGKYMCTKAIYHLNDSTRFYAWFSEDIIPTVGPETFNGLPGAILGLATEDGGVVYFAKKVELIVPDWDKVIPKKGKKIYTDKEFKNKLIEEFGDKSWGKVILNEVQSW